MISQMITDATRLSLTLIYAVSDRPSHHGIHLSENVLMLSTSGLLSCKVVGDGDWDAVFCRTHAVYFNAPARHSKQKTEVLNPVDRASILGRCLL